MAENCLTIEVQQEVRNATDSEFRTTMMANNAPDAQVAACKQSSVRSPMLSASSVRTACSKMVQRWNNLL